MRVMKGLGFGCAHLLVLTKQELISCKTLLYLGLFLWSFKQRARQRAHTHATNNSDVEFLGEKTASF